MPACPSCSTDNPAGSRFCNGCGAPLAAPAAAPAREERRTVTVLFADLVGFTSRSESLDPEDVRAFLLPYYDVLTSEVERHGGHVDRFLGDGIMAIFGAPTAHEDDPERAVRAALRILERIPDLGLDLHARVGVNTGPVLFAAAGGGRDDSVTGDTVNTAARLQALAPVDGVVVGEATHRVTAAAFEYEALEPALVKGKAEPIAVYRATAPRARLGVDLTRDLGRPYVGREADLAMLEGMFDKSVASSAVQLVTVVGEPGIGKSRIVAELLAHAQSRAPGLTWRQGRCLPYGEGITFWALGEIVKAHAGILETDDPATATAKVDGAIPAGPDRDWLRARLLPLVGVDASFPAERAELFAAWRTFLEQVAEASPTVLVFEDVHWADDAMLAFLEHLADRALGVPLLVVATARPELFERHAGFAAGLPNVNRVNLAPLSELETAQLVSGLLGAAMPAELLAPIQERAEGNPLYAEEFVRLLRDRDLLQEAAGTVALRPGAELPLPESIHALIAARLDTLPTERRAMLSDAAVVGKVFWAGAVAAMGGRDVHEVTEAMRELARRELVRPARRSSMAGESEYAFWHVLARDVAYERLPRASRAARHVAAAKWIESKAPDRVEDLADVLAHHYATALDLARAAGDAGLAAELESPALRFLGLAAERALGLDTAAALASSERAVALTREGHPDRAAALARFGEAASNAGRYSDARDALIQAITLFEAAGDRPGAAKAMMKLAPVLYWLGDPRSWDMAPQYLALLEPLPPGPGLIAALSEAAAAATLQQRFRAGIDHADRALSLAAQLGLPRPARALGYRGLARCQLGDQGGLDDFREAIDLATRGGQGREIASLHANYASPLLMFEGPGAALAALRAGVALAEARGLTEMAEALTASMLLPLVEAGEPEQALTLAAGLARNLEARGNVADLADVRATQTWTLTLRGQASRVAETLDWLEATSRRAGHFGVRVMGLGTAAVARAALAQADQVSVLLSEIDTTPGSRAEWGYIVMLPALVRTALATHDRHLAQRLATGIESHTPCHEHALTTTAAALSEANGDHRTAAVGYADAAQRWGAMGVMTEQAFAHQGHGRCLLALGDPGASESLRRARDLFTRLQAHPHIAECDALVALAARHAS
jgi:class 3 adenylate cyclase